MHCEAPGWRCWSEFSLASKFRGKYLQVNPVDINHLEFPKQGYHYTWHKVTTTVHNIIVGKLWVDNHGDMTINNHTTGDRCLLRFLPYSYFSRETPRKVSNIYYFIVFTLIYDVILTLPFFPSLILSFILCYYFIRLLVAL